MVHINLESYKMYLTTAVYPGIQILKYWRARGRRRGRVSVALRLAPAARPPLGSAVLRHPPPPACFTMSCTVTPAADVPAEFKALALTWPLWESKTHPQKPKKSGKFLFPPVIIVLCARYW